MGRFQIELDDGRKFQVEADTQPTPEEVVGFINQQQPRTEARPDEFLSPTERLQTGFRTDPEKFLETKRAERGLAPGTPLEPTGFSLENLRDLPNDVLDAVGPAFPAIGQIIGGILGAKIAILSGGVATPAIFAGGAAGSGIGEAARQAIGQVLLGFEQGTIGERAGRVALETALGAAGEGAAIGLNSLIRLTKRGMITSANRLLKRGPQAFAKGFGRIARNVDGKQAIFAINRLKKGDASVLSRRFSSTEFANSFANRLVFGKPALADTVEQRAVDLSKQIFKLSKRIPGAKEPVKDLFRQIAGITDETFEIVSKGGSKILERSSPKGILSLGKRITSKLDDLFKTTGDDLIKARRSLADSAKLVDVTEPLTQVNTLLGEELSRVGFLVREGPGLFSINPNFAGTRTGSAQAQMFGQLVARFFKSEGSDALISAASKGSVEAVKKLADAGRISLRGVRGASRKATKIFSVQNNINFGDFIKRLGTIDVQISGNEFKALGKLSPSLTTYLRGVRGITDAVADQVGNVQVKTLNAAFRELAEGAAPIRQGTRLKDAGAVEKILNKFASPKTTGITRETGEAFNTFVQKNVGVNFIKELNEFRAAQEIKGLSRRFGFTDEKKALVGLMKSAFKDKPAVVLDEFSRTIDPFLPERLKVALNARRHTVAESLTKDATSLLRARFIGGALGVGGLGAIVGGPQGAFTGATFALGTGFALQNPKILQQLLKFAASQGGRRIPQTAARQLPRGAGVAATQALRGLVDR